MKPPPGYSIHEFCHLRWKGTNEAKSATLEATGTWELAEAPRETNLEASCCIRHAKDNAVADTERYGARLGAHGMGMADVHNFAGAVARLMSIQARKPSKLVDGHEGRIPRVYSPLTTPSP